ncbi:MAG: DUF1345 domain-containing protein [Janthinobacterium lividum]
MKSLPFRVLYGHRRTVIAVLVGLLTFWLVPVHHGNAARLVFAWDAGSLAFLLLIGLLLVRPAEDDVMARHAEAQQEGEWTVFAITLAGVVVSFAALTTVLSIAKDMKPGGERDFYLGAVAATLLLSWLVTHLVFALRYAHEYYERDEQAPKIDGGLDFPGGLAPDYWDFVYFALVLGMTFQVSDVQITSRKLRRLATLHGLIGFLFNTVIVALTVNIAASFL